MDFEGPYNSEAVPDFPPPPYTRFKRLIKNRKGFRVQGLVLEFRVQGSSFRDEKRLDESVHTRQHHELRQLSHRRDIKTWFHQGSIRFYTNFLLPRQWGLWVIIKGRASELN